MTMNETTTEQREMLTLCESLKGSAEDVAVRIINRWSEIGRSEPWNKLPEDLDLDHLPHLIRALASAALCTDFDRERSAEVVRLSARHGEHRREEGFDDSLLYREYQLLRRALWEQMKDRQGENALVYYATMRVDAMISLANSAALHGLNRHAFERDDRWPQVLEELLDSWPLPTG